MVLHCLPSLSPSAAIDMLASYTFLGASTLFKQEILEAVIVGYDSPEYTAR
jgi:hypothetical protein